MFSLQKNRKTGECRKNCSETQGCFCKECKNTTHLNQKHENITDVFVLITIFCKTSISLSPLKTVRFLLFITLVALMKFLSVTYMSCIWIGKIRKFNIPVCVSLGNIFLIYFFQVFIYFRTYSDNLFSSALNLC